MRLGDRRKTSRYACTHPVKYAYASLTRHDPGSRTDLEVHAHLGRRTNDLAYGIAFTELSHDALELVNDLSP